MRIPVGLRVSPSKSILPGNKQEVEKKEQPKHPDKRLRRDILVDGELLLATVVKHDKLSAYPHTIDLLTTTKVVEVERGLRWRIVGELADGKYEPLAEVYEIKTEPVRLPFNYSVKYFNVLSRDRRHIVESGMAYSGYDMAMYRAKEFLYALLTNSKKYGNFFKEES